MEGKLNIAQLLMQQQKYSEAEKMLKNLLSEDPTDVNVLAMLGEVYFQEDKIENANAMIDSAIGISPDFSILFYIKARIVLHEGKYDEAEKYLEQALSLDPQDPDFYALWASIKLSRKQYEQALNLANKALEFHAEHILALNTRSTALLKLNRKEESFLTIEGALREDPNNSYTHANYGWGLLERGEPKKALEHFKEALKNNPNNENARAGMAEALKANFFVYRYFLKYSFWMSNLSSKYQWVFILGIYFGSKLLRGIADQYPFLGPFLYPVIILLGVFAFSTWIFTPVSNLFLRLNVYGKYLLDKNQILSSNFVGVSALVFLAGLIGYFVFKQEAYAGLAVFGLSMMVPLGTMFSPSKYRFVLVIYTLVMGIIGVGVLAIAFKTGEIFNEFTYVYLLSFIAFQWLANFIIIKQNNV
jgi:tetratricopeptide (TPR) repeat protein